MTSNTPTVFVCSATGSQGMALSRLLRQIGWTVHATVRDLDAPAAKDLEALGVKRTLGDWDNTAALEASIAGCDKLFLNLHPTLDDMDHERVQAQGILAIAKAAGVGQVVYSGGLFADAPERRRLMPPKSIAAKSLFSKNIIEGLVRRGGFEHWTILRGGFFMANVLEPRVRMYPGLAETNTWKTALTAGTQLPLVDHEDIARFAVAAFQDPERFDGQGVEIVGEVLTPGEVMALLSAVNGREMKAAFYSDDEIREQVGQNPFVEGQMALRESLAFIDMDRVGSWGIRMGTFKEFLEREQQAVRDTYP